ncbi:MAG TPA: ABC transporter permease, partial [Anaerolineaceae bacterium]|nr:ABC transporter permease [Anaerolineaceae bacterium]
MLIEGETQPASSAESLQWSGWSRRVWRLMALPLLLFFAVPIVVVLVRVSPAGLWAQLTSLQTVQAVAVSLRTTLISLLLIVLFGTPLGYLMGRYSFRGKQLVDTLIDLPTVLPPSVAGLALLMTFGRRGAFGGLLESLDVQIVFTQAAVILAQTFIAAAFYVRSAALGFAAVDRELLQSAQLDGANSWQTFRYVTLPLARNAMITGAVMSWARALGEFGATILFAGNLPGVTQTMPLAIYLGFETNLDTALTLSVILVL